jgi:hypothetical protein
MAMTSRTAIAVALAACPLAAQPASGAVVEGRFYHDIRDEFGSITIEDTRDQRNDLEVHGSKGRIVVRENGPGALEEQGNCRKESRRVVSCPSKDGDAAYIETGEGDDEVRVRYRRFHRAQIFGGPGDDLLSAKVRSAIDGGSGRDTLLGSRRSDNLYGGSGPDRLRAGGGRDILLGDVKLRLSERLDYAKPADDLLDGGEGRDAASWRGRTSPVRVDLRRQVAGAAGEHDELRSIESAVGGDGDDRLLGNDRPNWLLGGLGRDVLLGRGGDDHIDGGPTRQPFQRYWRPSPDRDADRIGCGSGAKDRVAGVVIGSSKGDRSDVLPQSCELMRWSYTESMAIPRLRLGAESVRVPLDCDRNFCDWTVTLRSAGDRLGRRHVNFRRERTLEVELDEPLRSGPPIRVVIDGRSKHREGDEGRKYHFEYRLRRPR